MLRLIRDYCMILFGTHPTCPYVKKWISTRIVDRVQGVEFSKQMTHRLHEGWDGETKRHTVWHDLKRYACKGCRQASGAMK